MASEPPQEGTIVIYYNRIVSLISPECGAQQEYVLTEVKAYDLRSQQQEAYFFLR
jgi:hypothetical protein